MLATGAALGTLFWFGFRFGSVLYVTPLLVLAIGKCYALILLYFLLRFVTQLFNALKFSRCSENKLSKSRKNFVEEFARFFVCRMISDLEFVEK